MQHIRDNEFDQLLRDKFEEAEVRPSVNLWAQIETQLAEKPKRVFPVYWMAAAIAVVAISLGLLLYPEKNAGKRRTDMAVVAEVARHKAAGSHKGAVPSAAEQPEAAMLKVKATGRQAPSGPAVSTAMAMLPDAKSAYAKNNLSAVQPLALNTHLYKNELTVKQEILNLPEPAAPDKEALVLASAAEGNTAGDEVINENDSKGDNKSIRNMGDLINYVVDKVDKSNEKIIQFKTDDDNSSLVALNIGIIRFNTKKHK